MKQFLLSFCCLGFLYIGFGQTYYPLTGAASSIKKIDWSDHGLISANNNWSAVPYLKGFNGNGLTSTLDIDPRTITVDGSGTTSSLAANQSDPASFAGDGFAEFESIANPTLAFKASNTANAPFLMFYINTQNLVWGFYPTIRFLVRDIDASSNNSAQQLSVQYRVGETGPFIPSHEFFVVLSIGDYFAGYHPDATSGPSLNHESMCEFSFPQEALNKPKVQVRVMITNASGGNEWLGIDDIMFGGYQLLPIKYSSFSAAAKNNTVQLQWNAATETMADHFEIERSTDGTHYDRIGTVFAKGQGSFDYNYTDQTQYKGTAFYRLKLIDNAGGFNYTNIATVKWAPKDILIEGLFPNIISSRSTLKINVLKKQPALLQIENMQAAVIKKQSLNLNAGANNIPIDASALSAGNYMIRIHINGETFVERFVKQ